MRKSFARLMCFCLLHQGKGCTLVDEEEQANDSEQNRGLSTTAQVREDERRVEEKSQGKRQAAASAFLT